MDMSFIVRKEPADDKKKEDKAVRDFRGQERKNT